MAVNALRCNAQALPLGLLLFHARGKLVRVAGRTADRTGS